MSAKHLHFEKAFLPREWAKNRISENPFPIILRDAALSPVARDIACPDAKARLPLRITARRKRTER